MRTKATLSGLLQGFFTGRLIGQRQVSPHTIASYRDTFRLLLRFAQKRLKKEPSKLGLTEIDAPFLIAFLDHLENERRQWRAEPQRSAGGDSFLLSLRRLAGAGVRRPGATHSGHPVQTVHASAHRLFDECGG